MANAYDEVYERYRGSGQAFRYGNHHLSTSWVVFRDEIEHIGPGKVNKDNLFVKCRNCDIWMDFIPSETLLGGRWVCPKCGVRMNERTAYTQLGREVEAEEKRQRKLYEDDDF